MTPRFPRSILAAIIIFILVLQVCAVYWHLYFHIWWLDIPVHILGGLWIALFGLASYYGSSFVKEKEHSVLFVFAFAVALTLSVGLFWEVYEFFVDHAVGDSGLSLADTLTDLCDDLLGAFLGALIFTRTGYHKKLSPTEGTP